MTVQYSEEARETLFSISDFIDGLNTEGSGDRWVTRFHRWLSDYAKSNVAYALCANETLASLNLSCIIHNDW